MRNKWKMIVMCLVMAAVILLEPVSYVRADEGTYSEEVPYLQGLEFNMLVNSDTNRGVMLDTVMESKTVDFFTFQFDKLDNVNYEKYDVVFDMVLKSKLTDGTVTTYEHKEVFDVVTAGKPGFFNGILMSLGLKDSYYKISMDFETLIKNSPDCVGEEKWVADNLTASVKKVYEYNTVITQVDCYLREKSTGNYGMISRFLLTWDSDFRKALCTNVTYNLVSPVTNEIFESGSNSNQSGAYGYDSDGSNLEHEFRSVLSKLVSFFTDIPSAIYEFVKGFYTLGSSIPELMKAVFPFIPGFIFDFFGIIVFLSIVLALVFRFVEK